MRNLIILIFSVIFSLSCNSKISSESNTMYINASGGLRMRSTPDLKGKKIITIPDTSEVKLLEEKGESITLAGKNGKWSKINYDGKVGWVFGGFLVDIKQFKEIRNIRKDRIKKMSFEIQFKAPFDPSGSQRITLSKKSNNMELERVEMGGQCSNFSAGGKLKYTSKGYQFSVSDSDCEITGADGNCDKCFTKTYKCTIPLSVSVGIKSIDVDCSFFKRTNNY